MISKLLFEKIEDRNDWEITGNSDFKFGQPFISSFRNFW